MALDPSVTTKDYSLIIYSKEEVDTLLTGIVEDTGLALNTKSDAIDEGSPSGIATLNSAGTVAESQLPVATLLGSDDSTDESTLITPRTLQYQIGTKTIQRSELGLANGVAPLNASSLIDEVYLPAARVVQTFVVELLSDMYVITTALEGDRCIVTGEALDDNNGEYVANVDYPVDISGWNKLPNLSSVASVNGSTGNVNITSIVESVDNASRISVVEPIVTTNTDRIDTLEVTVASNTLDIATKADDTRVDGVETTLTTRLDTTDGRVTVNEGRLTTLEDAVNMSYNYSAAGQTSVQTDVYTTINNLVTPTIEAGVYEVTLSMVFGIDSVVRSAFFRFSFDGGNTWTEVRRESQDVTDKIPSTLVMVNNFVGGVKDIIVQTKCEDANDTITIYNQTIIYERKA